MATAVVTPKDGNRKPKAVCKNFAAGKCYYGSKCYFSHEKLPGQTSNVSQIDNPRNEKRPGPADDPLLNIWRRKIGKPSSRQNRPLDRRELYDFCGTALVLVNLPDVEPRHQVITSLASDMGLARMLEVVEIDFSCQSVGDATDFFRNATLPLLQTITNRDVLSSLILEASKGTIFNIMYGIQGKRAVSFFKGLTKLLADIVKKQLLEEQTLMLSLSSALIVFSQIIECNQTANLSEEFPTFLQEFSRLLEIVNKYQHTLLAQSALRQIVRIRNRLDHGAAITQSTDRPALPTTPVVTFDIGIDGPGQLSTQGQRHDNDHEDICQIQIMPTAEEIRSYRVEYLPTTDPTKLHVGGTKGLLDRQFRLLREDTIGQLRDCVQHVLEDLTIPGRIPESNKRFQHGARFFVYNAVKLSDVVFESKGNRGLQVIAEFDQPHPVKNMAYKDNRQRWWSETKQMQPDSLLCLVDSNGGSVFMSLGRREAKVEPAENRMDPSESLPEHADDPIQRYDLTETDPSNQQMIHDLWSDQSRCAVTLQLVDLNAYGIGEIIGRSNSEEHVTQALVEFPGVLLPSFRPTLEALQKMSGSLNVPFSSVIAPDGIAEDSKMITNPPAYALQPSFDFDLSPITDSTNLSLEPTKPFDVKGLMKHSSLDIAQCEALVNALTRRLALIQGPPGTGKSYVTVQIVKTLLTRREKAEMGPIICV